MTGRLVSIQTPLGMPSRPAYRCLQPIASGFGRHSRDSPSCSLRSELPASPFAPGQRQKTDNFVSCYSSGYLPERPWCLILGTTDSKPVETITYRTCRRSLSSLWLQLHNPRTSAPPSG